MVPDTCNFPTISVTMFVSLLSAILIFSGCSDQPEAAPLEAQKSASLNNSSSACIDIEGTVFGDVTPGSNVFLYETSSLDYKTVMTEIRTKIPSGIGTVNESERFVFACLGPGRYTFVIAASSFNNAVGSPLPYEFDCRNLSLSIEFQGGDWEYSVGAFSIENSSLQNKSTCNESIEFCRAERGGLYKECPLG